MFSNEDNVIHQAFLIQISKSLLHNSSYLVGFVWSSIARPSINLVNLQIFQNNVVDGSHIHWSNRSLEYVVQIYSVHHVNAADTTKSVECSFKTKEVVGKLFLCA